MATYGIDVSKHQGSLDFKAIAEDNKFVILRIGYGVSPNQKDPKFEEYYKQAKDAGLKIGGYYYSYALTKEQAKQEAKNCLTYIKGKSFDLPIFFDMEDADGYKKKKGMPSSKTITSMCDAFCETIEAGGYRAGVYASTSWFKAKGVGNVNKAYTRWEARYGSNDGKTITKNLYNSNVPMHQYTSAYKGKYGAGGKTIKVDRNINYSIPFEVRPKKKAATSNVTKTSDKWPVDEVIEAMLADTEKTQSRSQNGADYSNKYTKGLAAEGYDGIDKNGVFTKRYSYGSVGHCAAAAIWHMIQAGYKYLFPKEPKYLFNTNVLMNYFKTEPNGVKWVSDHKKAKKGAFAFKGDVGKSTASHTCVVIKIDGDYIITVDYNVDGGKNGVQKKRHKKYFRGFANIPYATEPKASEGNKMSNTETKYVKGKTYTLEANMYVRATHSTSGHKMTKKELSANAQKLANDLGVLPKGTKVSCLEVYTSKSSTWIRTPSGWICAKDSKKTYIK